MTIPTNDDFANRELSIEELEAIAGGHWWNTAVHWIEHESNSIGSSVKSFFENPVVASLALTLVGLGGINTAMNSRQPQ
jgi:hypothetical protein